MLFPFLLPKFNLSTVVASGWIVGMQTVNIDQWLATPGEYFFQNRCRARGEAFLRAKRGAVEGLGRERRPTEQHLSSRQNQMGSYLLAAAVECRWRVTLRFWQTYGWCGQFKYWE